MNIAILMGRLVRDPEVRHTQGGKVVAQITLAVDKYSNGEKQADFINCVLWDKQAELVGNNVAKGQRLLVQGSISTRSYEDKNGQKRTATEVIVNRMEFVEAKAKGDFEAMGSIDTDIPF
jgi:single-strand DNA-binding protein